MIEVVCATLKDEEAFGRTPLGLSLRRMGFNSQFHPRIFYSNSRGLSEVYNEAIDSDGFNDLLLFVHDDVWIDDYFASIRIREGLEQFDVIGVAGNVRIAEDHVGWAFRGDDRRWDEQSNLRGAVAHGETPFGDVSAFGQAPDACQLLDGVLLAAKRSRLQECNVRFDLRFQFHFYDIDFCRTSINAGLSLGVWPIAITHKSGGAFGSPTWKTALGEYRRKWAQVQE